MKRACLCIILLMAHANVAFKLSLGHRHAPRLVLSSQKEIVAQAKVKADRRKTKRMQRRHNIGASTELFARNAVVTHATGLTTSYIETTTSSQEMRQQQKFKVGDTVTWTGADEDVPEGTPGVVIGLSTDDPGYFEVDFPEVILEVDGDVLQRVEIPEAAVAPTPPQEPLFKLGDTVTWAGADDDVPEGTLGVVIAVSTDEPGVFEVEFPSVVIFEINGDNLRPAAPSPPVVPVIPKPTPVERQKKESATDSRDALNVVGGVLFGSILLFGPQITELYTSTVVSWVSSSSQ
uniref:Uncharacterized protein n=1 Tax=Octactis speculum TaxID=3111310 RepID=A0A7S2CIV5_9STRA|mmetsp:Transcript_36711/g.49657  ORF Transcript_36711/g.49657 Transcript_36711/m.49657 type:complete len:291 (+) Transcript_36711:38-910(+)